MQAQTRDVRIAAIEGCRSLGCDRAAQLTPQLKARLEDEDLAVRLKALSVVKWLGPEAHDITSAVMGVLRSDHEQEVKLAIETLLTIDPDHGAAKAAFREISDDNLRDKILLDLAVFGADAQSLRRVLAAHEKIHTEQSQGANQDHERGQEPGGAAVSSDEVDYEGASPLGGQLPPSRKKAYLEYLDAIAKNPNELNGALDREVYDWVKEHADGEPLPAFNTWDRYVRDARKHLGKQKNTPRKGRATGKSVVSEDQIERPEPA
jgi:hypothetical protein